MEDKSYCCGEYEESIDVKNSCRSMAFTGMA